MDGLSFPITIFFTSEVFKILHFHTHKTEYLLPILEATDGDHHAQHTEHYHSDRKHTSTYTNKHHRHMAMPTLGWAGVAFLSRGPVKVVSRAV